MTAQLTNKKRGLIGIICLIIFIIGAYLYQTYQINKVIPNMMGNGIYTIGTIDKIEVAGRTGWYCYYHYFYMNSRYDNRCMTQPKTRNRRFIIILPDKPQKSLFLEEKVPSWFTAEAPVEGWKTKPTDEELRAIQNKADSIKAIKN